MEPFRPWVDYLVYQLVQQGEDEIKRETKQVLLNLLGAEVVYQEKKMSLLVSTHYLMADLKRCFLKQQKTLSYPRLIYPKANCSKINSELPQ